MAKHLTPSETQNIINHLKTYLCPGDTVYTKLVHVSRSGMYRVIDLYIFKNDKPMCFSSQVGHLLEGYDEKHDGAKAHGCGMDMGFHLVYKLSSILFPEYACIGGDYKTCPSPDHINSGVRDNPPLTHKDGYALRQKWF